MVKQIDDCSKVNLKIRLSKSVTLVPLYDCRNKYDFGNEIYYKSTPTDNSEGTNNNNTLLKYYIQSSKDSLNSMMNI